MSLRDAYYAGSTGIQLLQQAAFDAGVAWVGSEAGEGNWNAIEAGLEENAALGNSEFTVSITTTYLPVSLRNNNGNNLILKAYLAGIASGLAAASIFDFECTPALNVDDQVTTKIDLNFSF